MDKKTPTREYAIRHRHTPYNISYPLFRLSRHKPYKTCHTKHTTQRSHTQYAIRYMPYNLLYSRIGGNK